MEPAPFLWFLITLPVMTINGGENSKKKKLVLCFIEFLENVQ
jgi:hypothetical protein